MAAARGTPRTRTPIRRGARKQSPDPKAPTCPPPRKGKWTVKDRKSKRTGQREYKWDPVYKTWYMVDHFGRVHPADTYRRYNRQPPQPCEFYLNEGERIHDPSWTDARRKQYQDWLKYEKFKEQVSKFEANIPYDFVPLDQTVPRCLNIKVQKTPEKEKIAQKRKMTAAKLIKRATAAPKTPRARARGVAEFKKRCGEQVNKTAFLMSPSPLGNVRTLEYDEPTKQYSRYNIKRMEHPADMYRRKMALAGAGEDVQLPQYCSPPRDARGGIIHPKKRTREQREQAKRHFEYQNYKNAIEAWEKDLDWGPYKAGDCAEDRKPPASRRAAPVRAKPTAMSAMSMRARTPARPKPLRPCLKMPGAARRKRDGVGIQFEFPSSMIAPPGRLSRVGFGYYEPYPGDNEYDADRQPSSAKKYRSPPPETDSPVDQPPPFYPLPIPPPLPTPRGVRRPMDWMTPKVPLECQVFAPEDRFDVMQRFKTPQHYADDRYGPDPFSPPVPQPEDPRWELVRRLGSPVLAPPGRSCIMSPKPRSRPGRRGEKAPPRRGVDICDRVAIMEYEADLAPGLRKVKDPFQMRPQRSRVKTITTAGGRQLEINQALPDSPVERARTPGRPRMRWPRRPGDTPGPSTPSAVRRPGPNELPRPYGRAQVGARGRFRQGSRAAQSQAAAAQRRPGLAVGSDEICGEVTPARLEREPEVDLAETPPVDWLAPIPQTLASMQSEYQPAQEFVDRMERQSIMASTAHYEQEPYVYEAMKPPYFDSHPVVVKYDPRCPPADTFNLAAMAKLDEPEQEIQLTQAPLEEWQTLPETDPRYWEGQEEFLRNLYELSPEHKPFKGHTRAMVPTPPRRIPYERRWLGMPEPKGDEYRRKVWSQRDNLIYDPESQRWHEDPTKRIMRIYNPDSWFGSAPARPLALPPKPPKPRPIVPEDHGLLDLAYQPPCPTPAPPPRVWTPPRTPPNPLDVSGGDDCYTPSTQPPIAINFDIVQQAAMLINKRIADEQFVQVKRQRFDKLHEELQARKLQEIQEQAPTIGPYDAAKWYKAHPGKHHPTLPCPTGCLEFGCPFPMPPIPAPAPVQPPPCVSPPVEAFARRQPSVENTRLIRRLFRDDPDAC